MHPYLWIDWPGWPSSGQKKHLARSQNSQNIQKNNKSKKQPNKARKKKGKNNKKIEPLKNCQTHLKMAENAILEGLGNGGRFWDLAMCFLLFTTVRTKTLEDPLQKIGILCTPPPCKSYWRGIIQRALISLATVQDQSRLDCLAAYTYTLHPGC